MKIVNLLGQIYTVVDTTPDMTNFEVHANMAKILLAKNHQDDGGKWAEVEEVKEKKKRAPRKKAETAQPSEK